MFNQHPVNQPRAPGPDEDDPYGFSGQNAWPKFGINTAGTSSSADMSQSPYGHRPSFSSSGGMDWAPTPSSSAIPTQRYGLPQGNVQHEGFGVPQQQQQQQQQQQAGGGVGRLVAHFENKGFVPQLPPRPSNVVSNQMNLSQPVSSPFGSFNVAGPSITTPLGSPNEHEPNYDLLGDPSRMTSPIASPPPMSFGGFPDNSRVSSPIVGSASTQFGSLDNFMANNHNRVTSPMVSTPMMASPMIATPMTGPMITSPNPTTSAVPGTPGFSIWRPPAAMNPKPMVEQKPMIDQSQGFQNPNQHSHSGGFSKPPVPSTPKPIMNGGSQFIIDFNAEAKAKGKAPAKPPPKQPSRQASRSQMSQMSMSPNPVFSPVKLEPPSTPGMSQASSSPALPAERRASVSLRAQTGTRPSREQVPAEAWESYKSTIRTLYLEERKPLKEVMAIMAEKYNFQATPKMYKTRFSQWGFVKNNTEEEVKRLLSMKFQRDAEGKVSEFVRNGRVVNLGTYLKRKGVTEYDLIDFEQPADLPAHIRCRTPTPPPGPGYLRSPDLLRASETVIGNMRKAFLHCRQCEVETDPQVEWSSVMIWGAGSSDMLVEANFYLEMKDADQGGALMMRAFQQIEADLKKLSPQGIQELLLSMVKGDPGMMTALCKYLAALATTNFERSHPLRQIFTCLYEVQQKHGATTVSELLWASIPTIAEELEAIYGRRHPYVARTWIDLALFYNVSNPERLEKMVNELRLLLRQMENRQNTEQADIIALRYSIVQMMSVVNRQSEDTKQATVDLWNYIRRSNLAFQARDHRPNVYCYHSPIKVSPWTKRCRRRYDSGVQLLEEHAGIRVIPYFEEDFHTTEHVPEHVPEAQQAQDSWAAAMQQQQGPTHKWSFF